MAARFSSMIAIMRNCIKTGTNSCTVPVNSLCIRVLELLRAHGLIQGFSYVYFNRNKRKATFYGMPRVMIVFKYSDNQSPVLKDIQSFKNTVSNFKYLRQLKGNNQLINEHIIYIVSNSSGLKCTFPTSLLESVKSSSVGRTTGKIIAQLII